MRRSSCFPQKKSIIFQHARIFSFVILSIHTWEPKWISTKVVYLFSNLPQLWWGRQEKRDFSLPCITMLGIYLFHKLVAFEMKWWRWRCMLVYKMQFCLCYLIFFSKEKARTGTWVRSTAFYATSTLAMHIQLKKKRKTLTMHIPENSTTTPGIFSWK